MKDDQDQGPPQRPDSLLPYDEWGDEAQRRVLVRALAHVAANGMPGEHHFYIGFRTDWPGVEVPTRLLAQFPHEMTIVLQHQFWDLQVDGEDGFSVGLSFGGIPSKLRVPFSAVATFADPHAQVLLHFRTPSDASASDLVEDAAPSFAALPDPASEPPTDATAEAPQVVSLDAFRRRPPAKEGAAP